MWIIKRVEVFGKLLASISSIIIIIIIITSTIIGAGATAWCVVNSNCKVW